MLKKRIGAAVLIKDDWVVQSIGFKKYLPLGRPQIVVEFLNKWGIDEIFLIDISATRQGKAISAEVVRESSKYCRVPMAAGGGITTIQQMENLLHFGADKIFLNHILLANISLLTQGARLFGDQCMVGVIDFVENKNTGSYEVYDYVGKKSTKRDVNVYAKELQDAGAGEILLQSVERDGMYNGFEIELYKKVCNSVSIPVVALGGAGSVSHFNDVLENTDISAACAGNIFHFTEHSVNTLKAQLIKDEKPIRLETGANYQHSEFDNRGRLLKANDQYLEDLLFIRIEKEII